MAMITTPEGKPDMNNNHMNGLTAQFTDSISVGYNGLPFDLCLYDSKSTGGMTSNRWVTQKEFVVPHGGSFAQLDDYNDVFDHYTTANPGSCPHNVVFDYSTGDIFNGRSPS